MATVELCGLVKHFGSTRVLQAIDLRVRDGEFLSLLGPSGCGKSTLLRCIAGLEPPSGGEIRIDGASVGHVHPKDRDIAMVFQSYALYPHMTVRENLGFALKIRRLGAKEIATRVEAAADLLELQDLLDRYPRELSGGQRQRVAMGRAMVRRPKVFLFDEPLSNLDTALRSHMRAELARLHQELKATMIYVTHDQVEAMTLSDRVAIMRDGVIQQIGAPLDLYSMPKNRFVAQFIGSPAMNFLPVTAHTSGAGQTILRLGDLDINGRARFDSTVVGSHWLGVRPEHVRIGGTVGVDEVGVTGTIGFVELLGFETHVTMTLDARWGGFAVRARMRTEDATTLARGAHATLWFKTSDLVLFDEKTDTTVAFGVRSGNDASKSAQDA